MPTVVRPCIWFATEAEEAARFYTGLLPDSRVDAVHRGPADNPGGGKAGEVLYVEFTLGGRPFSALNGTEPREHDEAVSFELLCDDQAEVDRLWAAIEGGGGRPIACGWIADRWGVRWQVVPKRMIELMADPDRGRAKRAFEAMMTMTKLDVTALDRAADG